MKDWQGQLMSLLICSCVLCGFAVGVAYERNNTQDANELLEAGFTIIDPEGYEVERFEGDSYFTTEPK